MLEINTPIFYVLSPETLPAQEDAIRSILNITPLSFGIVSKEEDASLAFRFSEVVLKTDNFFAALTLARLLQTQAAGHPSRSIIIGPADILTAVYEDHEETIYAS